MKQLKQENTLTSLFEPINASVNSPVAEITNTHRTSNLSIFNSKITMGKKYVSGKL